MINATVFSITLNNGRKAFNGTVIERNDTFTILIDRNIKRYKTYQNLFFRIIQGVYQLDYIKKDKSNKKHNIKKSNIKNKNIFDNIQEFSKYNHPYKVNIQTFDITPIQIEKNEEFYQLFEESRSFSIFDYNKDNPLLNSNFEIISEEFSFDSLMCDFIKKIVIEDYSIAILEIESENRIDFKNLSLGMLGLFTSLKTNIKQLLGESVLEDRVALSIENKCLQTKFFIPKSEELNIQSQITKDNLEEIHLSNTDISETDKLTTSLAVDNIFNNKEINTLKFTFQSDISSSNIIEISLNNNDFELKDLKKEIKEFKDRSNVEEEHGNFLIDVVKGIYDERRTEFILIKKDTDLKFKLIFNNKNITDVEKRIKAKLLLSTGKDEIRVKLKYKKKSTYLLIEELTFLEDNQ